jgi:hypothetical protein
MVDLRVFQMADTKADEMACPTAGCWAVWKVARMVFWWATMRAAQRADQMVVLMAAWMAD